MKTATAISEGAFWLTIVETLEVALDAARRGDMEAFEPALKSICKAVSDEKKRRPSVPELLQKCRRSRDAGEAPHIPARILYSLLLSDAHLPEPSLVESLQNLVEMGGEIPRQEWSRTDERSVKNICLRFFCHESSKVKQLIVALLALVRDDDFALSVLVKLAKPENREIQQKAVEAIGLRGYQMVCRRSWGAQASEVGRALVQCTQAVDASVQDAAVTALAMIGDARAIADLLEGRGIFPSGPFKKGEPRWKSKEWVDFFAEFYRRTGRHIGPQKVTLLGLLKRAAKPLEIARKVFSAGGTSAQDSVKPIVTAQSPHASQSHNTAETPVVVRGPLPTPAEDAQPVGLVKSPSGMLWQAQFEANAKRILIASLAWAGTIVAAVSRFVVSLAIRTWAKKTPTQNATNASKPFKKAL